MGRTPIAKELGAGGGLPFWLVGITALAAILCSSARECPIFQPLTGMRSSSSCRRFVPPASDKCRDVKARIRSREALPKHNNKYNERLKMGYPDASGSVQARG